MIVVPVQQAPSRATKDLQRQIEKAISDFARDNPRLSPFEVQQALQAVLAQRATAPVNRRAVVAASVCLAAALGGVFAYVASHQGDPSLRWVAGAAGIAIVGLVALIARLSRGD